MKGTRHRILRAARLLFNERGVANVSQRNISDHIAISPGNLTYHFKKRDDIIEALYDELAEALTESIRAAENKEPDLETFFQLTKSINKALFDNRFFCIDFIHIVRANNRINTAYTNLCAEREALMVRMIDALVVQGIMRQAELPSEYDFLYKRFQLFTDFWMASIGTTDEDIMLKHTRVYTEIFMQSLYPYLTPKGKAEFKAVMNYD